MTGTLMKAGVFDLLGNIIIGAVVGGFFFGLPGPVGMARCKKAT
jgi:hypothetical protein